MDNCFSNFNITINISSLVKLWMGNSGLWEDRRPTHYDWTSKKIFEHLHSHQQHFKSSHTVIVIKADEMPHSLSIAYTKLGCNEICVN